MADNFAKKDKKNQYRSTDPIGERRRVKNLIREGREEGTQGGVSGGARAARAPGWDSHVVGRDPSLDKEDRQTQAFKQYDHDVFLKHGETEGATAVTVREDSIGAHTAEGKVGINIKSNGNILVQGQPVFKASGKEIIKGDFTENPQSSKLFTYTETIEFEAAAKGAIADAIGQIGGGDVSDYVQSGVTPLMTNVGGYPPHVHTMMFKHVHAVEPTYLWRMPAVGMMNKMMEMLDKFKELF
jgi:hypothetical protein